MIRKLLLSIVITLLAGIVYAQNFPFPQNATYSYGITATTANTATIQSKFSTWRSSFIEYNNGTAANSTMARVKYDDGNYTVSEGIGYGMLILVYMENATNNTQADFNKLYAYYQKFGNFDGNKYLMDWKIQGFTTVNADGSATDGDLDVALALLMAHKQWGSNGTVNYKSEAQTLLGYIYDQQVDNNNLIKPGHHWNDAKNPCYFTVASIGVFDQAQTQEGFTSTRSWSSVYSTSHTYLNNSQSTVGLWPDWTSSALDPTDCKPASAGGGGCDYSWDACRTPWRVAWDYLWFGNTTSLSMSSKVISFLNSKSLLNNPGNINSGYTMSGSTSGSGTGNSCFVGGFGAALMTNSNYQSNLNTYCTYLQNRNETYGYYAPTLQILYLLTMTGNTPNFYQQNANTAPTLTLAENIAANGSQITLTFSKALSTVASSQSTFFTIKKNGTNATISNLAWSAAAPNQIVLTISQTVASGETLTVSYAGGSVNSSGVALAAFTDKPVTNKVTDGNTLIADAEEGNLTKLGTDWYSYNDAADGGLSIVTPLSTDLDPFTMTSGGANGTANCAKITYSLDVGTLTYDPFVGLGFAMKEPEAAYDLGGSTGISFWHKGDNVTLSVALSTNTNTNYYSTSIAAHATWTYVTVTWNMLSQADWGANTMPVAWDATKIVKFQWQKQAADGSSGSISIDEVQIDGKDLNLGNTVDKTALVAAISTAQTKYNAAVVGTSPGQYPQSAVTALNTAISAATTVNNNAAATQTEVNNAVTALNSAIATFDAAKISAADKTVLAATIATANTKVANAVVGTSPGQYPQSAVNALITAINNANTVNLNATATQTEVNNAVTALNTAIATFDAAKIPNTTIDVTALNAKIVTAQSTLNAATIGTAVGNYPQSAATTFQAAIVSAQNIAANPSSQAQVDLSVTVLQTAIDDFNASVITQVANNTLVADAENGETTKLNTNWYSYNDSNDGGASIVTPLSSDVNPFTMTSGGANGTANCAQITFELHSGTLTWDPSVGLGFAFLDPEAAYDLTGSTGISFWHKGASCKIQVALSTITNYNYYTTDVAAHTNWTYVTITWGMLAQLDWGANTDPKPWDLTKVVKIQWQKQAANLTAGSISIDEVQIDGKILSLPVTVVNKTALVAKISEAQTLYNAAVAGTQTGQYPASAKTTFGTAINTAVTVNINASATQTEVDAAVTTLTDAIVAFQASQIGATVDKTALAAKISEAQTLYYAAVVGTQTGQYPASAKTTFGTAINTAVTVNNNASATQTEVDAAVTALNTAIATFQASQIGATVDKTALVAKISEAQTLYNAAVVGTEPGQYPASAVNTFNTAISAANTINNNAAATQTEVNTAVTNLTNAIADFIASVNPTSVIDVSVLSSLITEAQALYNGAVFGTNPGQYPVSAGTALLNEITIAQNIVNNPTTQVAVDAEVSTLQNAMDMFELTRIGDPTIDVSALESLITQAENIQNVVKYIEGDGVGQYSSSILSNFADAIHDAQVVASSPLSEQMVTDAITALTDAIFDLYHDALAQSISAANDLLSNSTIGTAVGEYPQSAATELQSEITSAAFVLNLATDISMLADANSDLSVAVEVFLDAEITTGLDESEVSVSVYPTPASDYISVVADGLLSVTVISTNGQIVIVAEDSVIDVSSLTSGVYSILVVTENGVATVSQIIK